MATDLRATHQWLIGSHSGFHASPSGTTHFAGLSVEAPDQSAPASAVATLLILNAPSPVLWIPGVETEPSGGATPHARFRGMVIASDSHAWFVNDHMFTGWSTNGPGSTASADPPPLPVTRTYVHSSFVFGPAIGGSATLILDVETPDLRLRVIERRE
jgi:hypothetical protein